MTVIADNLTRLNNVIRACAHDAGRDPFAVQLIAVSKQQSDETIDDAFAAGQRVFGENKVQEAQAHWGERKNHYDDLVLHMIGPLQTNKVADAVALFDVIQTIDRVKLADAVKAECVKQGRAVRCFIQVNIGGEEQKAGIAIAEFPALLSHCRAIDLAIDGLMCIPPLDAPPGLHFALLKKMAMETGLPNLSMGMSGDFEKAIALGATSVRLGTAVFGPRAPAV